jgi:uncharacterized protein YjiS (DUF1127 family)
MTAQDRPYPAVQSFIETFAAWLRHRRELSELQQLDRNEHDRIADDLRISPTELDELVRHGPHAADELPRMLKALGIDEQALARAQPMVLRDMERVCALCGHKAECDRDLDAGTAADNYENYCLNAPTIDRLERADK